MRDLNAPWPRVRRQEEWDATFARLREEAHAGGPPPLVAEDRVPYLPHHRGYRALVRHADVAEASRRPDVFASAPSAVVPQPPDWRLVRRYAGHMMIDMDAPRHTRIRRVVSRAFTPRRLDRIDDLIAEAARDLAAALAAGGPGDFAERFAVPLPVRVIGDMMGIPRRDHARVGGWARTMVGMFDPARGGLPEGAGLVRASPTIARIVRANRSLATYGIALARERIAEPRDDLASVLVRPNDDGERLGPRELGSFFVLLLVAGGETTGNALAHGLRLLTGRPDQRELLLSDMGKHLPGAVEEVVRCASPVLTMRRTLTRDHVLNGHPLRRGERVMLFYRSANRDEAVFARPGEFDVTRSPNPHLGFGGPGPHHCLGAHLARRELTAAFTELFARLPGLRSTGEPELLASPLVHGVRRLDCTW